MNTEQQRLQMVAEHLERRGIDDERILKVFRDIPREQFVPQAMQAFAYDDRPLPIGFSQTISQPYMVALMTMALETDTGMKVLEIGTGSGYQAAILSRLVARVFTIERVGELTRRARQVFESLRLQNIVSRTGDGTIGWEAEAPFDRIIVTAGSPDIPLTLRNQLSDGGRLVIPVGDRKLQQLKIITRQGSDWNTDEAGDCTFVPLIGREGWNL